MPRLLQYISDFHAASPWSGEALSPEATKRELQALIAGQNSCVFIHDHGAIGGHISRVRFGNALMAQEIFWWSERDGFALLRAFEDWAAEQGASLICVACLADQRFEKIYGRRGYQPRESFFVKTL